MLKIIISGCNGRMGKAIAALAESDPNVCIAAGIDVAPVKKRKFPRVLLPYGVCR